MPRFDPTGVIFEWAGTADQVVAVGTWCEWRAEDGVWLDRDGDGHWSGHLDLAPDAYVEYRLLVDGAVVPDPSNGQQAHNGVDGYNDQLWMPGAQRRAIRLRSRRGPRGTVQRGHVNLGWMAAAPRRRQLDLYLPPGFGAGDGAADPSDLPLVLVLDGPDYLERGRLDLTLDGLINAHQMAPVAAAFVANAGQSRAVEYGGSDFTLATLANDVVPAAVERLGLSAQAAADATQPGRATILGSSMGGLMALHAALRRPDLFGTAIAQSVAAFTNVELSTIALVHHLPPPPIRIWQDAGDHEWLAAANDDLARLLQERGYDATYRRQPGGHDQTSWVESLVDALPALFPPGG